MARFPLAISFSQDEGLPKFLQIARSIAGDIRRGRLRCGQQLPSSRRLAEELGVHRNTAIAAYAELAAEGWITTEPAKGTFVSHELPEAKPRRFAASLDPQAAQPTRAGYDLPPAGRPRDVPLPSGVLSLSGGIPDMRLVPVAALARAYRRALRHRGSTLLNYGDPQGHHRLREALLSMLAATRGIAAGPEGILVTRGSQMALYLIARAILKPGDLVAVEAFGYRPAWEALQMAGAKLVPVPVDANGLCVDKLVQLASRRPIRAVYATPHHQYPTTVTLAASRRLELLEFARATRTAIIEDDYDHEFHYEGRPVLPLASVDAAGVVMYVGTLSKVLAPGLRIGYVVAPPPVIERLTLYRTYVDHLGDQVVESAVAEMIEDGELARHVGRARRAYRSRRDTFVAALRDNLGDLLSFAVPPGGMALWAGVNHGIDVNEWAARALSQNVAFAPGDRFSFDHRRRPCARLGFAMCTEDELLSAVRILAQAVPRRTSTRKKTPRRQGKRPPRSR